MTPPCIFLVFNRPAATRRSFERIRAARPPVLWVVADGPRETRPAERDACAAVRTMIEEGVDWKCELVRDYSAANLGCARRVSSGISAAFAQVEEAVVIEDDCVPDPTFFPFCAELLERYRGNPRVSQIAGFTFNRPALAAGASYYFSRYPHCWGWATWRRAWARYDHGMSGCRDDERMAWLDAVIPDPREREVWRRAFLATARGQVDSWAYRWTYSLWRAGGLSANPSRPLVDNIGFGPEATHTVRPVGQSSPEGAPMDFPLVHPASTEANAAADAATGRNVFRPRGLASRVWGRLRRLVPA